MYNDHYTVIFVEALTSMTLFESRPVVLKRAPLGSLKEEFLISGGKFVPRRNWGGKAVNEKTLSFYYLFIQHIKNAQRGWLRWQCRQYAMTSCFNCMDRRYKTDCLVHNRLLFLHSG